MDKSMTSKIDEKIQEIRKKKDELMVKLNTKIQQLENKKSTLGTSDTKSVVSSVSSVSTKASVAKQTGGGGSQWKGPSQANTVGDLHVLNKYTAERIDKTPMFDYAGNHEFATPSSGVYLESQCWNNAAHSGAHHSGAHMTGAHHNLEKFTTHEPAELSSAHSSLSSVKHGHSGKHGHGGKHGPVTHEAVHHGKEHSLTQMARAIKQNKMNVHDLHPQVLKQVLAKHPEVSKHVPAEVHAKLSGHAAHSSHAAAHVVGHATVAMPHVDSPSAPHISHLSKYMTPSHGEHPMGHHATKHTNLGPALPEPANAESAMEHFSTVEDYQDMNLHVYVHQQPHHKKHGLGHLLGKGLHDLEHGAKYLSKYPHLITHPIFNHVKSHLATQSTDCPPMSFETEVLGDGKHKLTMRLSPTAKPFEFHFNTLDEVHAVFNHMKQVHPGHMTHCHLNFKHEAPQTGAPTNLNHLFNAPRAN